MHAIANRPITALILFLTIAGWSSVASGQANRQGPHPRRDQVAHREVSRVSAEREQAPPAPPWPIGFRRVDAAVARTSTTANASRSLVLPPPTERSSTGARRPESAGSNRSLATVFSSLALVLGLFFLAVWFTRRTMPQRAVALPKEVVEVLGHAPLQGRQQLQLVRLGRKLLLLGVSANGAESLAEISEPEEVERLLALCEEYRPRSVTATFRQILMQLGSEPAPRSFLGDLPRSDLDSATLRRRRRSRSIEEYDA